MSEFDDLVKEGDEFFEKEEYGEALECYNKALGINPYSIEIHAKLGNYYLKIKDYKKAIVFYNRHIELNPKCHHEIYHKLGEAYLQNDDYENALDCCKKSLIINPNFEKSYANMGMVYSRKAEFKKAIEYLDKAIELNPNEPEYYFKKVLYFYYSAECPENFDELIEYLDKAIELNSENPKYHFIKGDLYYGINYIGEALKCYDKALELNSEYSEAHYAKGFILYYDSKEKEKALEEFHKSNGYGGTYCLIGDIYYSLKDYENAFKFYGQYVQDSNDWERIVSIFVYRKKIMDIFKISSKYPENPLARYIEGKIHLMNNDVNKAINSFISAIRLNPAGKLGHPADNDEYFTLCNYLHTISSFYDNVLENILESAFPLLKEVMDFKKTKISQYSSNLVHYTTPAAVESLVKNGSYFRLSNVNNMNDPEEGKTLLKFLQENKIKGISRDYPLGTFYGDTDGIDIQTTFVGSFLRYEDKLYLWRTYGKDSGKEDAKGMCIVLNSEFFEKKPYNNFDSLKSIDIKKPANFETILSIDGVSISRELNEPDDNTQIFMPVIYDVIYTNEKGLDEIKTFLEKIKPYLEKLEKIALKDNGRYSGVVSAVVRSIMDEILYLIKSDNYEEELESRILVTCGINNPKIRYNEDVGFPYRLYIEIEKPFKDYIEKIVLGPKVDDCARWKLYLNREGIKVKESNCNYR